MERWKRREIRRLILILLGYIGFIVLLGVLIHFIPKAKGIANNQEITTLLSAIHRTSPPEMPFILKEICKAESGLRQFNEDGTVLRGFINPNDIGYCQINEPTWGKKAEELGLDIYKESGNIFMAIWIYDNYGTEPWRASKHLWINNI